MISKTVSPPLSWPIFDSSSPKWYTGNNASLLEIEVQQVEEGKEFSELGQHLNAHLLGDSSIVIDLCVGRFSIKPFNRLHKRKIDGWTVWADFAKYNLKFLSYRDEIRRYERDGAVHILGRGHCSVSPETFQCLENVDSCAAILSLGPQPDSYVPSSILELSPETLNKGSILEIISPSLGKNQVLCYGWAGDYYEPYALVLVGESSTIELLDGKLSSQRKDLFDSDASNK